MTSDNAVAITALRIESSPLAQGNLQFHQTLVQGIDRPCRMWHRQLQLQSRERFIMNNRRMAIADVSSQSLTQLLSLQGRRAVVTGAGRGLGKAICNRLAEAGARVLVADLDTKAAERTAAELSTVHAATLQSAHVDVSHGDSIAQLAATAVERFGGIDIWINNAGIFPVKPLLDTTDEEWDRVLDINLRGVFIGCREAARRMIAAGHGGVIVNLSSVAGLRGVAPGITAYVSSKHGVCGATNQLAVELAPHGIRVLGVAPTTIRTEGVLANQSATVDIEAMLHSSLGRAGVPDDVARVVLFCVSDMAVFMTGSILAVDAGRLALG